MSNIGKLLASNEILGAFVSDNIGDGGSAVKTDASGYIAEQYGLDLSAFDLQVVENSAKVQHLTLPYYEVLDSTKASIMTDEEAQYITGGEFVIAGGAIIATAVLGGAAALAVTGGVVGHYKGGEVLQGISGAFSK